MKRNVLFFLSIVFTFTLFLAAGCGVPAAAEESPTLSTNTVAVIVPTATAQVAPTRTPVPLQPSPTPVFFSERLPHVQMVDESLTAGYVYRGFLQIPVGVAWGPDEALYMADWMGHHVVRMAKDFAMDDLPFWQTVPALQADGPRNLTFDSQGNLYINNHSRVFRIATDGTVTELQGFEGSPIGSILMSPSDELYYTDRGDRGCVRKWMPSGYSQVVAGNLPQAESLVFGLDGTLYLTQMGQGHVLKVDLASGTTTTFAENVCGFDPCYLAVDPDGDIWVRGIWQLTQISPDGTIKPYTIDGHPWDGGMYNWHTAGGIAFDDEGGLWVTSYSSRVWRLAPVNPDTPDPEYTLQIPYYGVEASDLDVGPGGSIYGTDINTRQVLRFTEGGEVEALLQHQSIGRSAVAVDENGGFYTGLTSGEILYTDPEGITTHFADLYAHRMVFGIDGALYAASGDYNQPQSVVKITGMDDFTTLATQIDGISLGNGEVHITPALDDGFYVFTERERNLFFMDYSGEGRLIANLQELGGGGPVVMAASPVTGDIFYIPHGPYNLFRITPEGESEVIAYNISGDPWGMVVSRDGEWLYVAESGAIDKIPISD